jgi:hypothetical protein
MLREVKVLPHVYEVEGIGAKGLVLKYIGASWPDPNCWSSIICSFFIMDEVERGGQLEHFLLFCRAANSERYVRTVTESSPSPGTPREGDLDGRGPYTLRYSKGASTTVSNEFISLPIDSRRVDLQGENPDLRSVVHDNLSPITPSARD